MGAHKRSIPWPQIMVLVCANVLDFVSWPKQNGHVGREMLTKLQCSKWRYYYFWATDYQVLWPQWIWYHAFQYPLWCSSACRHNGRCLARDRLENEGSSLSIALSPTHRRLCDAAGDCPWQCPQGASTCGILYRKCWIENTIVEGILIIFIQISVYPAISKCLLYSNVSKSDPNWPSLAPLIYSWSAANTAGETKKKVTTAILYVGQCAGNVCTTLRPMSGFVLTFFPPRSLVPTFIPQMKHHFTVVACFQSKSQAQNPLSIGYLTPLASRCFVSW